MAAAASQVQAYLSGQRQSFSLPLDLKGTPFQMQAWRMLLRIPYGEVRSYRWLAEQLGGAQVQAAVQAAVKNPIPIIVPCHRVIDGDGTLGGFVSGLERKRWLLASEGVTAELNLAPEGGTAP